MNTSRLSSREPGSYSTRKVIAFYGGIASAIIGGILLILVGSVIILRWVNPSFTAFTLQEDWEVYEHERYNLRPYWVEREELPGHLRWAVIASEDQQFREHSGFDLESIREAWQERSEGEGQRGASTITQQVAKNLYLWPGQSWLRKGVEAGITVLIELFWPKERIMEVYLNIAEFGPGLYGIGKSSQEWFDKPAHHLEAEESARLAAVLPNPKRMRAEPPSPFVEERSEWILIQMTHLTGIAYFEEEEPGEPPELQPEDEAMPPGFRRQWNEQPDTTAVVEDTTYTFPDSLPRPSDFIRQPQSRPDTLPQP